jgi:hypothetical protein
VGEQLLSQEDKAMAREKHFYTVTLVLYASQEVKQALSGTNYLNVPQPWYTSTMYYFGTSEAKAARALLKAAFDGQSSPLANSVILRRDAQTEVRLHL